MSQFDPWVGGSRFAGPRATARRPSPKTRVDAPQRAGAKGGRISHSARARHAKLQWQACRRPVCVYPPPTVPTGRARSQVHPYRQDEGGDIDARIRAHEGGARQGQGCDDG